MTGRSPAGLSVAVEHQQGGFRLEASFDAPAGVTALFGRSGSGKTTLVNIVAGLVRPRRGRVTVGGRTLLDVAAGIDLPRHRRRIGYVFQEGRLFPHLSVRQNLLFGRWFSQRRAARHDFAGIVDLLDVGDLMARRPANLSGGEKQRVAIGRALLADPELLLMDEPLAALDEARKAEILPYLERLRDEAGVPIVYVSHAMAEVARLADTLVVLEAGRVVAAGPLAAVLGRLDVPALAGARDGGAVLDARVTAHERAYGLTTLSTQAGDLRVPAMRHAVGSTVRFRIQARDVMLSLVRPEGLSALNVLPAIVAELAASPADIGSSVEVRLDCGGAPVLARITRLSAHTLALAPGMAVFVIIKSVAFEEAGPPLDGAATPTG